MTNATAKRTRAGMTEAQRALVLEMFARLMEGLKPLKTNAIVQVAISSGRFPNHRIETVSLRASGKLYAHAAKMASAPENLDETDCETRLQYDFLNGPKD